MKEPTVWLLLGIAAVFVAVWSAAVAVGSDSSDIVAFLLIMATAGAAGFIHHRIDAIRRTRSADSD